MHCAGLCSSYGLGSKLGPFAAFTPAPTDVGNCHPFRELLAQLVVRRGRFAQGVRSHAKPLKINKGTPIIWEQEDEIRRLSGKRLRYKLLIMNNLVGERGFEPPTPWSRNDRTEVLIGLPINTHKCPWVRKHWLLRSPPASMTIPA